MSLTAITESHIDAIALGAVLLGTGGGGDPHVGALTAKRLIRKHGPVPVVRVEDLTDDDFVVPVGMIGAPSVSIERIASEGEYGAVLDLLETATGRPATAVMPIEIGGGNSLVPVASAALRGLPVLDADSMGRAFPEAQMVTYHLAGYEPGLTSLVDSHGNAVLTRPVDGVWSERLARALTIQMGGSATMADYAYGGTVVRECVLPGTLSLAHRLGQILLSREVRDDERVPALLTELDGHLLFEGKIADLRRGFEGGFTKGRAVLHGTGDHRGSEFELDFQNEMLLGRRDGELAAVTPDLISVLDQATGHPITTERLQYGARVTVVGIPCHEKWRTPRGIETAGPAYFGYDTDYVPVEELAVGKVDS